MTGKEDAFARALTEEQDEVLESIWRVKEKGGTTEAEVLAIAPVEDAEEQVLELERIGMIRRSDGRIDWLPPGEARAKELIRRHRLMEILLAKVFGIAKDPANRMACDIEHILNAEATDNLCGFLSHPALCPEGRPIPRGPCCAEKSRALRIPIRSAFEAPAGTKGRILYLRSKNADRLDYLSGLGVVPGTEVVIHQIRPALVLIVGETELALDPEVGKDIFLAVI